MPSEPIFTFEQVRDALIECKGIQAAAARVLGCSPNTIGNYFDRWPELEKVTRGARRELADHAEIGLWKLIRDGDGTSIRWTLGRLRPEVYGEKVEATVHGSVTVEGGTPITLQVKQVNEDANRLDEILTIMEGQDLLPAATNGSTPRGNGHA